MRALIRSKEDEIGGPRLIGGKSQEKDSKGEKHLIAII